MAPLHDHVPSRWLAASDIHTTRRPEVAVVRIAAGMLDNAVQVIHGVVIVAVAAAAATRPRGVQWRRDVLEAESIDRKVTRRPGVSRIVHRVGGKAIELNEENLSDGPQVIGDGLSV